MRSRHVSDYTSKEEKKGHLLPQKTPSITHFFTVISQRLASRVYRLPVVNINSDREAIILILSSIFQIFDFFPFAYTPSSCGVVHENMEKSYWCSRERVRESSLWCEIWLYREVSTHSGELKWVKFQSLCGEFVCNQLLSERVWIKLFNFQFELWHSRN